MEMPKEVNDTLNTIDSRKKTGFGASGYPKGWSPVPMAARSAADQTGDNPIVELVSNLLSGMKTNEQEGFASNIIPGIFQRSLGVGGVKEALSPKSAEAAPVTPANAPAANAPVAKHPMEEKYKGDYYAAAKDLSDKSFKKFVDDHPDIPGMGYVEGKGGKLQRIIENPAEKAQDVGKLRNIDEVKALAGLIHAKGVQDQALAYHAEQIRTKDEALELAKQKDWESKYGTFNQESGKYELNAPVAVAKTIMEGGEVPRSNKGLAAQIRPAYEEHVNKWNTEFDKKFPNSKLTAAQKKVARDRDFLNIFNPPQAK